MRYTLHVVEEDSDAYRWVSVSHSDDDHRTYRDAFNTGTLALAAAGGQRHENQAAAPVGHSTSETDVDPTARSVGHHHGEAFV